MLILCTLSFLFVKCESFNNVINIFQDKRISFSDEQYKFRSNLAVLHWNENVDRKYTSIWKSKNPNAK
jgi:hypothetical protein